MNAELTFLQFLQSLHSPMLDGSMCFITRLGDSGILWVTLTGNRRHGDSIALTKSLLIAVYESCRTGLALSGASRQLPQRGKPFAERFDPARN